MKRNKALFIALVGCLVLGNLGFTSLPSALNINAPVLDNFNRANGGLGANWFGASTGYAISSNTVDVGSGDGIFWGTQYGADQEAFFTFSSIDPAGSDQAIVLKSQSRTTWSSGALAVSYKAASQLVQVWTFSGTQGWVQRGTNVSAAFANGDRLGAHVTATGLVEIYKNNSRLGTADASGWTHATSGGYIGLIFIGSANAFVDDFGGGTVAGGNATNTTTPAPLTPTRAFTPVASTTAIFTSTSTAFQTPTLASGGGFPQSTALDTFNRANGSLGANWFSSTGGYAVASNRMDIGSGGEVFWGATQFGAEQEAFTRFLTIGPSGSDNALLLKSQSRTTYTGGVIAVTYRPQFQAAQVLTYSNAQGWAQRGANIPVTLASGDQLGARARSNGSVEVYKNGILIGTRDASGWTYSANGGYVGMWFIGASNAFADDFGGGNISGSVVTNTPVSISTLTGTPTQTSTSISIPTLTPTMFATATRTSTPIAGASATATSAPSAAAVFSIGTGGTDSTQHQVVRAANDRVYAFVNQQSSSVIRVYRTVNPGLPASAADFTGPVQVTETSNPISVDAVYDGGTIIHVLVNLQNSQIKDYPFDTSTNTFRAPITLATDGGAFPSSPYVGTTGVSGMVDASGILQIVYWSGANHIQHRAYTYNSALNTLTPSGAFTQVDSAGSSNHPTIAVSPADNSVTIAWVSEATNPARILTRARASNGVWGNVETASTSPVWHSTSAGLNIDQSPSLIIDPAGTKHLVYIQEFDGSIGDYGRIHYVTNSGSGWVDQAINALTHDPALAINSRGEIYIIGHGHPFNSLGGATTCLSMDDMCMIKKNSNGTWATPTLVIANSGSASFDSSPSVKWSVKGFNRPETIEFLFFSTPYESPALYYARIP